MCISYIISIIPFRKTAFSFFFLLLAIIILVPRYVWFIFTCRLIELYFHPFSNYDGPWVRNGIGYFYPFEFPNKIFVFLFYFLVLVHWCVMQSQIFFFFINIYFWLVNWKLILQRNMVFFHAYYIQIIYEWPQILIF